MSSTFTQTLAKFMKDKDYGKIAPFILDENPGPLSIKLFNSVISGLSNLTLKDRIPSDKVSEIIEMIQTQEVATETTYTSLIKLYCGPVCYNMTMIYSLLNLMKSNGFKVKRRTMAPIFEMCVREDLYIEAIQFYAEAKALGISLEVVDYINLLDTPNDYFKRTLLADFMKSCSYFKEGEVEQLKEIFLLHSEINVDETGHISPDEDVPEFVIPQFTLSEGEKKGIKDSFHLFVNKFTKNSKKFMDFGKYISKMDYNLVIDGANIGFFKKGTDSGKVLDYRQIKIFVEHAIHHGYKPLLVLHSRHNNGNEVLREIMKVCPNHYFTPKGMDDDIFWLYASLMKSDCNLLTNDELRNHLFYMDLGEKFINWKKYNRVTYDLKERNRVIFKTPLKYMENIHYDLTHGGLYVPYESKNSIKWHYFQTH